MLNRALNLFYHVNLPNQVLLEHLPGICGVTHVLEALGGIPTRLLQQNLLASWMLQPQNTLQHNQCQSSPHAVLPLGFPDLKVNQLVIIYY